MLVNEGIHLTKLRFSVSPAEQRTRFAIRLVDPVRQWKFCPMDVASVERWDDYTAAKEEMLRVTDTDYAPWIVVKSNDKKRACSTPCDTCSAVPLRGPDGLSPAFDGGLGQWGFWYFGNRVQLFGSECQMPANSDSAEPRT
jgi:Polyphosphate kinase 2 (PPK2)